MKELSNMKQTNIDNEGGNSSAASVYVGKYSEEQSIRYK